MALEKLEELYSAAKEAATAKVEEAYSAALGKIAPATELQSATTKAKKPAKRPAKPLTANATAPAAAEPAAGGMGVGMIALLVVVIAGGTWALTRRG